MRILASINTFYGGRMSYTAKIKDWPEDQRPRERLLQLGAEQLTDAELLAIILRFGNAETTALGLAQKLLSSFDGFRGLESRSSAELCNLPGLGPAKVAQLKAALEVGKRFNAEKDTDREVVHSSRDIFARLSLSLRDRTREVFVVLFLSVRNHVIRERILFEGSLTESMVSPREVIKEALNESAASLVFAHNHPSAVPTPSPDDIQLTKKLVKACSAVGIRVLDHVIIAGERYFSFADEAML